MGEDKNITINLKKIHVFLTIVAILIGLLTPVILGFVNIGENSKEIVKHDKRIEVLENNNKEDSNILLELRYNLRNFMNSQDQDYIELKTINK